jgi:hypothetical protein
MGAAKKSEKFPVQILSLDAIKVDHALQSRVKTSLEYQREFSEAMLRGDVFPPVTVFWDGKVYWLADGFHRVGAAKQVAKVNRKLRGIRAEVKQGSRRDAMVFSAGANIKFSIPRTAEDLRKAVEMLLSDPDWFGLSDSQIAVHCGVSPSSVRSYRNQWCAERGIDIPDKYIDSVGRQVKRRRQDNVVPKMVEEKRLLDNGTNGARYSMYYRGRKISLGLDRRSAEIRRAEILGFKDAEIHNHSEMTREEAITEARRMGDPTPGSGWRRLLWRMADLLEGRDSAPSPNAATRDVLHAADAGEGITRHTSVDELFEDLIDPPAAE